MRRFIAKFIAALMTFCLPVVAFAGAWLKKPGDTYTKLAGSYFSRTGVFDVAGNFDGDPGNEYAESAVRLYSEVGIVEHFSAGLSVPFKQAAYTGNNNTNTTTGAGDLDVFFKYGDQSGICAYAGKLKTRIPLYQNESGDSTGTAAGQGTALPSPVLGDGSFEVTPMATYGCALGFAGGWFSAEAGPNFRFGGFGDGIDYAGEIGLFLFPDRLALKGGFSGIQRISARNEKRTKTYITLLGSAIVQITDTWGLEATGSYIPTGFFVAQGWTASLGVSYNGALWSSSAKN
jgi:hypothetical protein